MPRVRPPYAGPETDREHRALIRNAGLAVRRAADTRKALRRATRADDAHRQEVLAKEIVVLRHYGQKLRIQMGRLAHNPGLADRHESAYRTISAAVQDERHKILKMANRCPEPLPDIDPVDAFGDLLP